MKKIVVSRTLLLAIIACTRASSPTATQGHEQHSTLTAAIADTGKEWFWYAPCQDQQSLTLSVLLDQRVLYAETIPICYILRAQIVDSIHDRSKSAFSFRAPRPLVWWGYRAEDEHAETTATRTAFETSIWQAGADSDLLLIGLAVIAKDGSHMNTVHIARPQAADTGELADGLIVITATAANVRR